MGAAVHPRDADQHVQPARHHERRDPRLVRIRAREEEGTQTPVETIERKSGTCRDYALLLIEAARSLGFGARFVTGYLYDPALDGGDAMQGAGATHAWAEIYLPGAGWVEFDPTNGLVAGENLIRVAVTRDPAQAVPIAGSFAGEARLSRHGGRGDGSRRGAVSGSLVEFHIRERAHARARHQHLVLGVGDVVADVLVEQVVADDADRDFARARRVARSAIFCV